jgi:hypothetical protein
MLADHGDVHLITSRPTQRALPACSPDRAAQHRIDSGTRTPSILLPQLSAAVAGIGSSIRETGVTEEKQ